MFREIPDRWEDYKPVGEKIEGTRFIPFKVPLKEHVAKKVASDIRLDGIQLLKLIPNLGLIIDLTNTCRYYNPNFFIKEGVEYKKIMVPGRTIPPTDVINRFNMIVTEFMESNKHNDKLIGVHCTHGVNRTGFFICNYMISQMAIEPSEALKRFATARGHEIERKIYLDELHTFLIKQIVNPNTSRERSEGSARSYNIREKRYDGRKLRSPLPYYTHNNNRNDQYHRAPYRITGRSSRLVQAIETPRYIIPPMGQTDRRPYYPTTLPAPQAEEQIRINNSNSYEAPSLRLDYYNERPIVERRHNRDLNRYTNIRK